MTGPPLPTHFHGNFRFKRSLSNCNVKTRCCSVSLKHAIKTPFFGNWHEAFLHHVQVHYTRQSAFGGKRKTRIFSWDRARKPLILRLLCTPSVFASRLSLPKFLTLRQLTCPDRWKVGVTKQSFGSQKKLASSFEKCHSELRLPLLHLAAVRICNF